MYQSNRSFNIPPGQPPGHLNFWKIFVQIPPSPGWKAVPHIKLTPLLIWLLCCKTDWPFGALRLYFLWDLTHWYNHSKCPECNKKNMSALFPTGEVKVQEFWIFWSQSVSHYHLIMSLCMFNLILGELGDDCCPLVWCQASTYDRRWVMPGCPHQVM